MYILALSSNYRLVLGTLARKLHRRPCEHMLAGWNLGTKKYKPVKVT